MRVSPGIALAANDLADVATRIVEYATRDQAQNAVNTLSNQNLMGRLVYVREVGSSMRIQPRPRPGASTVPPPMSADEDLLGRIVRPSLGLPGHRPVAPATTEALLVEVPTAERTAERLAVVAGSSTSPTFVSICPACLEFDPGDVLTVTS